MGGGHTRGGLVKRDICVCACVGWGGGGEVARMHVPPCVCDYSVDHGLQEQEVSQLVCIKDKQSNTHPTSFTFLSVKILRHPGHPSSI